MYQPQLIEVDPQRIRFNKQNPRKHQGSEFDRLKQSVREVGVVQLPTVRILPGGFYEVIDGEGRVRSAQDAHEQKMHVVSFGHVSDEDALIMLMSANSVREFTFLAECRGLANLHRQGQDSHSIAKKVGITPGTVVRDVAIGYLPDQLLEMVRTYLISSADKVDGFSWGTHAFDALLPLRQTLPGKDPRNSPTLDGVYDYTEVQRAIEKIVEGEIKTQDQLNSYVAKRKFELFQQKFDQELQVRLQKQLDQTRQVLEEASAQQIHDVKEATKQQYESQVITLKAQLKDTELKYSRVVTEIAKKPDEKKIIAQREQELREKMEHTELERQRLQTLQQRMQEEMRTEVERAQSEALEELRSKIDKDLAMQRKSLQQEYERVETDLKSYYAQQDRERQVKATETVQQMNAHGVELLATTQQWLLHITSPGVINGLKLLAQAEIISLMGQISAMRDTLEKAEETLRHGGTVHQTGKIIDEASEERSLTYGQHSTKA